jgi:hypothetical protein
MKNIKDELQHIILGHEPAGQASQLKKIQRFLRSDAETSFASEKQQRFKSEETAALLTVAEQAAHEKPKAISLYADSRARLRGR